MIKRALAATLCLMLVFALLPKTARAASPASVTIWGMELNSSNPYYKNGNSGAQGSYGSDSNWNARYENGVLTLKGLNVTNCNASNGGIYASGGADVTLTIELEGDNRVSMAAGNAIVVYCSLVIYGTGTLTATAGARATSGNSFGIRANDITMNGGSVTGKGGTQTNSNSFGVYVSKYLTVSGGTLTGEGGHTTALNCNSYGVCAQVDLEARQYGTIKGKAGTTEQGESTGVRSQLGSIIVEPFGSITGEGGESNNYSDGRSYGVNAGVAITVKENGYLQAKAQDVPNHSYGIVAIDNLTLNQNATTLAQGYKQALHSAANLSGGTAVAMASKNYDGSGAGSYFPNNNNNYKYFRMPEAIPATQITVTQDSFPYGQAPENETIKVTSNAATFNFNASNSFDRATMDGGPIDVGSVGTPGAHGRVRNGSILIQLNKAYLDTLPVGTHTLRVYLTGVYAAQYIDTQITVLPSGGGTGAGGDMGADVPKTGDAATPVLWLGIALLASAGLAVSAVRRRKRQNG